MNPGAMRGVIVEVAVVTLTVLMVWIAAVMTVRFVRSHRERRGLGGLRLPHRWLLRGLAILPTTLVVHPQPTPVRASAGEGIPLPEEDGDTPLASQLALSVAQMAVGGAIGAGVLARIRARRNGDHRAGSRLVEPVGRLADDLGRVIGPVERLVRGLMRLGPASHHVVMVVLTPTGAVRAEVDRDIEIAYPWRRLRGRLIEIPAETPMADDSPECPSPECRVPALFAVGNTGAGEVWINLDHVGEFAFDSDLPGADEVWTGLTESLALSPFTENSTLIGDPLVGRRVFIATDGGRTSAFASAVASSESGTIVIDAGETDAPVGIPRLRRGGVSGYGIEAVDGRYVLNPAGIAVVPVSCSSIMIERIEEAIGPGETVGLEPTGDANPPPPACVPPHTFVACVMGPPEVRHVSGPKVRFEKSKTGELVSWLATHPHLRRRSLARDALWPVPVRDSTFCNITSDARRSMGALELASDGGQWLGITGTDELPLHQSVISDVEILRRCVDYARRWPESGGIDVLKHGLGLVRGVPFAGSAFLWNDLSSITGDIVMLVTKAAQMCAELCADAGDTEGLMWATSQGLRAIPGHEGLTAMRLRQLAERGAMAEFRQEWEAYCRVLASDNWGDASPPHSMCELYNSLTRP